MTMRTRLFVLASNQKKVALFVFPTSCLTGVVDATQQTCLFYVLPCQNIPARGSPKQLH